MSDIGKRKPKTHYEDKEHIDFMDEVLDMGDMDKNGNKHVDHQRYEDEMERRYIGQDKPKVEHHNDNNEIDGEELPF